MKIRSKIKITIKIRSQKMPPKKVKGTVKALSFQQSMDKPAWIC
jgi:hypothetical protein